MKTFLIGFVTEVFIDYSFFFIQQVADSPRCLTAGGKSGICIDLRQCDSLFGLLETTPLTPDKRALLKASQCGTNILQGIHVCCPDHRDDAETTTPEDSNGNEEDIDDIRQ